MSNIHTLKLKASEEKKLYDTWHESASTPPAYAKWQLRVENCVITCYNSGKTVFQGKDADVYAAPFLHEEPVKDNNKPLSSTYPQAGSDEVGTGDYFGPVCVVAAIVTKENEALIKELGIRDSKAITDETIRKAAPQLMKAVPYSLLIIDNPKYNAVHNDNNMNMIKAKLHNQAYVNLSKKATLPSFKIVDQFTPERSYYNYLRNEPKVIGHIHFETKAEDKYPAVAVASVIARYAFLVKMDEMEKKYGMSFKKGASSAVDECAKEFVDKYGFERLNEVAKLHFKNTDKINQL